MAVLLFYYLKTQVDLPVFANNQSRAFAAFRRALKAEMRARFHVDYWTEAHLIAAQLDSRVRWINSLGWTQAESEAIRDRGIAALTTKFQERQPLSSKSEPLKQRKLDRLPRPLPSPSLKVITLLFERVWAK